MLKLNQIYVSQEKVPIITLDEVANLYLKETSSCCIKIDTQGCKGHMSLMEPKKH